MPLRPVWFMSVSRNWQIIWNEELLFEVKILGIIPPMNERMYSPGTRSAGTSSSSMSVHWTLVTLWVWMLAPCPESPAYGLGNLLRNAICVSDILMHFFLHFEKFPRVKVVWQSCSLLKLVEPVVPLSCWDTKALSEECNTHNADKLFMIWNGLKSRPSRNLLKGHFVHPPLIEC